MDVIAIIAQKGGTGKTTLALSMAVAAQRAGRTVAIIDLDPQASASNWVIAAKPINRPLFQRSRPDYLKSLRQPKRAAQIWSLLILHHELNGPPSPLLVPLIWCLFLAVPQSSTSRLFQQHLTSSPPLAQSHSPPYSMRYLRAARNANKQSRR